ncbi:MAG: hypothetical protein Q9M91_04990 [Candidatus Dojkabacteria bacterium]|nr:hypothetical protein [Candidatus Dojkabacteria bacterium]MDQ7021163.1 hypothetical protein [Candidatus Dojkabacteria bacterium]
MKPSTILELVSKNQFLAERLERYKDNPYVKGDTTAEHISRGIRLISYIAKDLEEEFPKEENLIQDLYATFSIHDDDEILHGSDVDAYNKGNDKITTAQKISLVSKSLSNLDSEASLYLEKLYTGYKNRSTKSGQIAVQIDRLVGNQLVIEQRVRLISPLIAKFCIEYVEKEKAISGSVIMDHLINEQIASIIKIREEMLNKKFQDAVNLTLKLLACPWSRVEAEANVQMLLEKDLAEVSLGDLRVNRLLWEMDEAIPYFPLKLDIPLRHLIVQIQFLLLVVSF